MKQLIFASAIMISLVACNNTPKGDAAQISEAAVVETPASGNNFKVDTSSTIIWTGSKPTGSHTGTVKITEGTLVADTAIRGGSFLIDMKSIINQDLESDPENKAKLEGHLRSADFFNVDKYPTAKFEITKAEPFNNSTSTAVANATHTITGNLTLKDVTKNISFPAQINIAGNTITALADFNVDRSDFNVSYKGPNNPQDWVISKQINFKMNLSANK